MKNCGKIRLKRTKLDRLMNRLVVLVRPALGAGGGVEGSGRPAVWTRGLIRHGSVDQSLPIREGPSRAKQECP